MPPLHCFEYPRIHKSAGRCCRTFLGNSAENMPAACNGIFCKARRLGPIHSHTPARSRSSLKCSHGHRTSCVVFPLLLCSFCLRHTLQAIIQQGFSLCKQLVRSLHSFLGFSLDPLVEQTACKWLCPFWWRGTCSNMSATGKSIGRSDIEWTCGFAQCGVHLYLVESVHQVAASRTET